ncbi:DNA starvation/stationary phase protection protein [Salipaludibacillus agaradhaerens]|jgi:starvation-inducible DNA-binding protein|uniref:DNA starvation/stationary phase protection protein n=1 Tax=Salipaludibacillus agaradhaerens TaxID=76935 RepID=A0A9Q4B015_SALAG|nr:DNA starvation/stationary phase protection protein [Salipaludibacillus agaradhaerens]MCR6114533.1 DNA starvation/stationary phase protection protein [Salipaludibacillus agaradhaerens]
MRELIKLTNEKTVEILNRHIANWNTLFVKLHNYHWFVKGPHFFMLHEKFEELYNEAAEHIDEIAERLLTLKGTPVATMKEYLEMATIKEAMGEKAADDMVQTLSSDFEKMTAELEQDIGTIENEDDETTADMLIGIRQSVEKHNWMFRSFLEK